MSDALDNDIDQTTNESANESTDDSKKDDMTSDTNDEAKQAAERDETTAADATAETTDAADTNAAAQDVQFSIVFDDDDDDHADAAESASDTTATDDDAAVAVDIANVSDSLASAEFPDDKATDAGESSADDAAGSAVIGDVAGVAAANAARVNETLALGKQDDAIVAAAATAQSAAISAGADDHAASADDQSLRLSVRLDKELKAGREDDKLLKAYPSLAFNKVTLTDRKSGHNTLDRVSASFYKGHLYAIRVDGDDERVALLGLVTGMTRPTDGAVMNKSLNVLEIDPGELLGHRFGLIPQRYAVRDDLNAEQNVLYAMDASGRTFLKPKPVLARELLMRVGFDADTPNVPAGKLPEAQRRLVAIARAISCDAEVIIADEPTGGLDADDSVTVLKALLSLTHGDDKRCVVVLTSDDEVAEVAEHVTYLSE
ncbi:ATP-binding cassette domain-containing protein [Bifidobacterium biavatii]|uniref:ABC transporter ATP-binding protein n=1 Tax=Bifidobacterium biavatii DSM 23969 TaxID=1437608 RepID=A0A086ZN42_9BIFI|nr:ATP-binding cassette domain-containing protein [Bifidobacterium biavatii]KFI47942.1 ABC transporter ATP-binding protein [Bifidobacterium biavatii DSM 23969]